MEPSIETEASSPPSDFFSDAAPYAYHSQRPRRAPQKFSDWARPGHVAETLPVGYKIEIEHPFRDLYQDYVYDEDLLGPVPSPVKCKKCKRRQKKRPRTRLVTEW